MFLIYLFPIYCNCILTFICKNKIDFVNLQCRLVPVKYHRLTINMKKYYKIILLLTLSLSACLEKDNTTFVIPPYEVTIPETIIPSSMIDSLRPYMTIYDGEDPPVIEGGFLASPMELVHASDIYVNNNFYNTKLLFSSQSCRNMICYNEEQSSAQLICDDAIVTGRGSSFTFAGQAEMHNAVAGWSCVLGLVISGERSSDGTIRRLEYANIMLEKNDPYNVLIEVGDFRVYRDSDGTTTPHSWQPSASTNPVTDNIMKL